MGDLVLVVLHHIHVPSLYQNSLAASHRLEQRLISLLFLYNLLFGAELLPLLPNLLLNYVLCAQIPQLLFQHQLMVLISHEVFNLLLTSLQFHHDLLVPLLNSLAIVTLSVATVLEVLTAIIFLLVILGQFLLVEGLHLTVALFLHFLRILEVTLHLRHLMIPMRLQLLA